MNPEMPDDVEIGYSSSRMLPLVALAARMTLFGVGSAFDWFGHNSISRYHTLAGYTGPGFFGIAISRLIWLLSAANRPVLLIGRYGIRDLRVAHQFILWDSIAAVSTCEYRRRKFVALKMTPSLGLRGPHEGREAVRMQAGSAVSRPGSTPCEMLRLGYITEKSEPHTAFSLKNWANCLFVTHSVLTLCIASGSLPSVQST